MARSYFSIALRIDPATKPKLYEQIYEAAEFASTSYMLDLLFSAGIATLGLVLNSPAVVIGAMLISPLMGPILATGLAFAASDIYLGVKSFVSVIVSVLASVLFSALVVWQLPFQSPTTEILARTQPNLLDLGVAVFSGLAGSVVVARSFTGGAASALPGVAIAVALMPPLCAVGFGIGSNWNWPIISGAGLLFVTNIVAITASAFLVFYLVGMDAPEVRSSISEEAMRHATGNRLYSFLHDSTMIGKSFGGVGHLSWRILMMVVSIAILYVPLRSSLMQLRDETLSRAAAREALSRLVPSDHVLSQQLEILPDRLIQRVVTTTPVDKKRIAAAELDLSRRTGKSVSIQVRQVANEEELITLRERLRSPSIVDTAPPRPDLAELGARVGELVHDPILSVWPAEAAEFDGYEIGFAGEDVVVRLSYFAPRPLGPSTEETIRNALRNSWNVESVKVVLDRRGAKKPPPPPAPPMKESASP